VLANGFFVATEFALVSVRRTRMQQLAAEGNRRASSVLRRLDHLDTYIAATQLGITIASLGLGWLGEPAVSRLIAPALARLPGLSASARDAAVHTVSFVLAFALITALHIVVGELAPKSLALQRPEQTALFASGPIHLFEIVFRPVIALLNGVGNAVVRSIGIEPAAGHALVQSAEELRLAVDASREAGLVNEAAQELVDRAFLFSDLDARQVMTPRTEMHAVPAAATFDEVLAEAIASGHSRLPVYEGDLDHVIGVVDVKRLLPRVAAERCARNGRAALAEPFDVRSMMRDVLVAPETAPASALLALLREARAPMAIVIDEFGGAAGMVTLADLVEDLIGDIDDELGAAALKRAPAADGSFSLDGLTTIVEAKEFYDLELDADELDVDTVGGYVFSWLGRPAVIGDRAPTADDRVLVVEDLDGFRVAQVRVLPAIEAPAVDVAAGVAET
jgi:CBS domain containing-hemolysin-like protein